MAEFVYRNPVLDRAREESPYLFSEELRKRLREQYPDHERQIWVGDGPEWSPDSELDILASDAVTALMVAGYETLRDHPILPSSVMGQVAEDIRVYGTGRYIKDPQDASDFLLSRTERPHINEFLRQAFGLVEDVHSRGLHVNTLVTAIESELPSIAQLAIGVKNRMDESAFPGQLCTAVWQELLMQRIPQEAE